MDAFWTPFTVFYRVFGLTLEVNLGIGLINVVYSSALGVWRIPPPAPPTDFVQQAMHLEEASLPFSSFDSPVLGQMPLATKQNLDQLKSTENKNLGCSHHFLSDT